MGNLFHFGMPTLLKGTRLGMAVDGTAQPTVFSSAVKHFLQYFLFVIWLFLMVVPVPIEITPQFTERRIGRDISILEDRSGQLTFDQVLMPDMAAQFVLSTKESPSYGYTQRTYWVQFELKDQCMTGTLQAVLPIRLKLAYAQTDTAELGCFNKDGGVVIEQLAGDQVPRSKWPISYRMSTQVAL